MVPSVLVCQSRSSFELNRSLLVVLGLSLLIGAGCSGKSEPEADSAAAVDAAAESPDAADAAVDDAAMATLEEEMAAAGEANAEPAPAGAAPFDTTFLDAGTELFVHAKISDILDSSLVKTLTGGDLGSLREIEHQIGVSPREIASVTIGVRDLKKIIDESASAMSNMAPGFGPAAGFGPGSQRQQSSNSADLFDPAMADEAMMMKMEAEMRADEVEQSGPSAQPSGPGKGDGTIAVVRTKSPVELENFERAGVQRVPHSNKAFYRIQVPNQPKPPCLYVFDSTTLVVSDEATIKQVIAQGEKRPRPTADLGFIKQAPHLLIAIVPKDKAALIKQTDKLGLPAMGASAQGDGGGEGFVGESSLESASSSGDSSQPAASPARGMDSLLEKHAEALALLVDLSAGIGINVVAKCDTPEAAQQIQTQMAQAVTGAKEQYEAAKASLPGFVRQMADPLVASLTSSADASVVLASATLPEDQQASLSMLPMLLLGTMMSSAEMSVDGGFDVGPSPREIAFDVMESGQPSANTGELPEGLEVKALARWGTSPYGNQAPKPLEIAIVASGEPAVAAIAYGYVKLTDAKADEATKLKWTGVSTSSTMTNALTGWVFIDRDGVFAEQPEDAVVTGVQLVPPMASLATLQLVTGELKLQVPSATEEIMVTDISKLQGGQVPDEKLAAAVMTVNVSGGQLEVSHNESPKIGKVELVNADGSPLETVGTGWSSTGGRKTLNFGLAGPMPETAALRVFVHADLQEVVVPFRFENLPMPEPQELSPEQSAQLVWTRGESPENHPDLIVEAQARWRNLEPANHMDIPPGNSSGLRGGNRNNANRQSSDGADSSELMEMTTEDMEQMMREEMSNSERAGGTQRQQGKSSEQPLRIIVDLIGPLAQEAEELGLIKVASTKTDIDTNIAFEGAEFGDAFSNPVEEFVEVDRDPMFGSDNPPGGLRIILKMTPPNQPITSISQLNGSLKVKTVRERTEAILHNLQSRVGKPEGDAEMAAKPVTDRELVKFRLKPVVGIGANRVMMRLLEGKDERISDVTLLDLDGNPITNVERSQGKGTGSARERNVWTFDFTDGVPQKLGMKISLNMGIEEIEIPIRIRDLPLPPMPEEP